MRLSRAIPAGIVDAAIASLATFVLNLYAIGKWQAADPPTLGIYFLFMTAFLMASSVPTQLLFIPAEKLALDVPQHARVALFGRIAWLGLPVAILAALLVSLAALVGASEGLTLVDQAPFLITAGIASIFSPLQNHARRLLHLAGRSWAAASVSLVQAGTAIAALLALVAANITASWIPIGALAAANIVSVGFAASIVLRFSRNLDPDSARAVADARSGIRYRRLAPAGRWLVGTGVISTGNNFLVESAVVALASSSALALAGSAKTVAQPILVLAAGLRAVLGPPSMEAARKHNRREARRVAQTFSGLMILAVLGYIAIVGFDWVGNPLARLVDQAYTVPFLVVLTIAANGLNGAAFPGRLELIGAGRERKLFGADLRANVAQLGVAVAAAAAAGTALVAGSLARPIAFAVLGATRIFGYERSLDAHYGGSAERPDVSDSIPPSHDVPGT